jgi:hypothetical protein
LPFLYAWIRTSQLLPLLLLLVCIFTIEAK